MQNSTIEGFRLSPQQKRIWSLQGNRQQTPFRTQCAILIEGRLVVEALRTALDTVIRRHEILRTRFECLGGLDFPLQTIANEHGSEMACLDLCGLTIPAQKARLELLFEEMRRRPFDFQQTPLLHLALLVLSPKSHALLISLPALCGDRTSLEIFLKEISASYQATLSGPEPSETPMQYADLSEWQNELIESGNAPTGLLRAEIDLAKLKLPFGKHPNANSEFAPESIVAVVESQMLAGVEAAAKRYDSSIPLLLVTCWQVLLWRLIGEPDVPIGVLSDCRKYQELEGALGLFAKYLPLQSFPERGTAICELLRQVKQNWRELSQWEEDFDWDRVADSPLNATGPRFFPFVFEYREAPAKLPAGEVYFSIIKEDACIDRFQVKLSALRREEGLLVALYYDSNLYAKDGIERLLAQFSAILASATSNPEAQIETLEILAGSERHQLLVEFNDTKRDYRDARRIHQLFEERAEKGPDQIALVFEDRQLSYRELNSRANQLAHQLRGIGVGPEVLVGICVRRSLDMVIALLGILKAGGAYVPMDPELPKERLAWLLQDTQASAVLTQTALRHLIPPTAAKLICLDTDEPPVLAENLANPLNTGSPANLAYVIYTSGTTGRPKGVAVEHRQIVNYTRSISDRLQFTPGMSFATVSTIAADLGNTAIFPALCLGGCLHVISQERGFDAIALASYFETHVIDCLKIVPSHLASLQRAECAGSLMPKRRLVLGGEAPSHDWASTLKALRPECRVDNHYGPTEGTVGVLTFSLDEGSPHSNGTVPLGRPLANTWVYVLDAFLKPVPIGVPGEVYIGGLGVARGYWNQPDVTAERFLPDPYANPGDRIYKTGDMARYLPDGNLEFLGRADHQIKMRGFRIELEEIEAVLEQHAGVHQCVVLMREDVPGEKRLVAYVVPALKSKPDASALREFLADKLPDYMVPVFFVVLDGLPLTPNGKVDRRALPAPAKVQPDNRRHVAPQTPFEITLAQIWEEILGARPVGVQDNFFELGGDSILGIQVIAKANRAGIRFTPTQFFENPTIQALAAIPGSETPVDVEAEQGLVAGPLPMTPIMSWFFEQRLPNPNHFNQAILLEVRPGGNPVLISEVIRHLLGQHDALRLRCIETELGHELFIADSEPLVPFVSLALNGSELQPGLPNDCSFIQDMSFEVTSDLTPTQRMAKELQQSLDISCGPLLRVAFFNGGPKQTGRLLICIHHLAVDGVSLRVLLEDLERGYEQLSQGKPVEFPPKTTSFKQWAHLLSEYAQSATVQDELSYWLSEPHQRVRPLRVDQLEARERNTVVSSRTVSRSLSLEDTRALLSEVPKVYSTKINDVMLTALALTFAHWTGTSSLLVDLEGHGREPIGVAVDLSRTVGWFTTIFPVLLDITGLSEPGEVIKSIKEQLRRIPNQGIGYGLLRYLHRDSQASERLRSLPQAEVRFNYLGQFDQVFTETSPFRLTRESCGPSRSPQGMRRYLLDIFGSVVGGQLQMDWTFSENVHQHDTTEALAERFMFELGSLISHCRSPEAGGRTPSDFPLTKLDQDQLDRLLKKISKT